MPKVNHPLTRLQAQELRGLIKSQEAEMGLDRQFPGAFGETPAFLKADSFQALESGHFPADRDLDANDGAR